MEGVASLVSLGSKREPTLFVFIFVLFFLSRFPFCRCGTAALGAMAGLFVTDMRRLAAG
jgi:hypothetical protein